VQQQRHCELAALEYHATLADSELDVVTGGLAVTDPTTILACLLSGLFTQGSTLVHEPVHAK
jgi:hypothetical protein